MWTAGESSPAVWDWRMATLTETVLEQPTTACDLEYLLPSQREPLLLGLAGILQQAIYFKNEADAHGKSAQKTAHSATRAASVKQT